MKFNSVVDLYFGYGIFSFIAGDIVGGKVTRVPAGSEFMFDETDRKVYIFYTSDDVSFAFHPHEVRKLFGDKTALALLLTTGK